MSHILLFISKRQYLLALNGNRFCLSAVHGSILHDMVDDFNTAHVFADE